MANNKSSLVQIAQDQLLFEAQSQKVTLVSPDGTPYTGATGTTASGFGDPTVANRVAAIVGSPMGANSTSNPVYTELVVSGAVIDPRSIRALTASDIVSAVQSGTWTVTVSNAFATEATLVTVKADTAALVAKDFATQTTLAALNAKVTAVDTGNVTVVSSALPTGAATSANQSTANTSLAAIDASLNDIEAVIEVVNHGSPATAQRVAADLGVGGVQVSNANPVPIQATNLDIRDLSSVTDSVSAVVTSSALPTGAATAANQATQITSLSSIDTSLNNIETVITVTGTGAATGAQRVVLADESSANRGRSYVNSTRTVHTSIPVTTGTWVELISSLSAEVSALTIFSSSGSTLEIGIGAAAAETRTLLVPPGGFDAVISLRIPTATRVSVRAVDTSATTGELQVVYFGL